VAYADKILLQKIKYQDEAFNFAKLPSIILTGDIRFETSQKITNEEIIEHEGQNHKIEFGVKDGPKERFTMAELKAVAKSKGITYFNGITFDELYSKLFS
jgi:hypothetical protein